MSGEATPRQAKNTDLVARLGLGGGTNSALEGVAGGAMDLAFRHRLFQAGVELAGDSTVLGKGRYSSVGALAGIGFQDAIGVRLELVGATGVGEWGGVGCGMFCNSGGASASLPFVGGRANVGYVFSRRASTHFALGVTAYHDEYLGSKSVDYVTTSDNWLSEGTITSTDTQHFSGSRSGALVTAGVVVDL